MPQQELDRILADAVKQVKAAFSEQLCSMILFGSYARGDYDEESDIDIALLFTCSRENVNQHIDSMAEISTELGLTYGVVVSFIAIPKDEYEKWLPALPFYQNIEREGVRLIA